MVAIKFKRYPHHKPKGITSRKLKAQEKILKKEREKFPLLTDWIADQQPTAEEKILKQQQNAVNYFKKLRNHDAKTWIEARKKLRSLPKTEQLHLIEKWNNSGIPKSAEYFADFIRRHTKQISS